MLAVTVANSSHEIQLLKVQGHGFQPEKLDCSLRVGSKSLPQVKVLNGLGASPTSPPAARQRKAKTKPPLSLMEVSVETNKQQQWRCKRSSRLTT
ncbi:hypothetical protein AMECASPLE_009631 [Ameca splendens]|uniref:Uncharacterized protein n=1 Tax=Ameca splendens TaxID=208324 RepID=A0ABV0Y0K5_9TELE